MMTDISGRIQVYNYFNVAQASNSYLIWYLERSEAILIDPVLIDTSLFEIIAGNNLEISAVFLTNPRNHTTAIRSIPSIYPDTLLYGPNPPTTPPTSSPATPTDSPAPTTNSPTNPQTISPTSSPATSRVIDLARGAGEAEAVDVAGCSVKPLFIPDADSLVYCINNFLFTGEILSAGKTLAGSELLTQGIEEKLFTLPGNTIIFPLYGPPTTIRIEKEGDYVRV